MKYMHKVCTARYNYVCYSCEKASLQYMHIHVYIYIYTYAWQPKKLVSTQVNKGRVYVQADNSHANHIPHPYLPLQMRLLDEDVHGIEEGGGGMSECPQGVYHTAAQ